MPAPSPSPDDMRIPLCVDLDGTLVKSDTLAESLLLLAKTSPLSLLRLPLWLLNGKAFLKRQVSGAVTLNAVLLPYHPELLQLLRHEHARGRTLVLVTAADQTIAERVAAHIGLFSEVVGSDGSRNLAGKNKLALLTERFGEGGFDYAGNDSPDLQIWDHARHAIIVHASKGLIRRVRRSHPHATVVGRRSSSLSSVFRSMRPHQWVKNLLVFVPLVMAHKLGDPGRVAAATAGAIAFCVCSSGVYILNDLLDLFSDRLHPRKMNRPLAAGDALVSDMFISTVLLLATGVFLGSALSQGFLLVLLAYVCVTTAYTLLLKQIAIIDVLTLAALYTLRIHAGTLAADVPYSGWLLAFSLFIFLSLALVKRVSELRGLDGDAARAPGRGYARSDEPLLSRLGIASGFLSVLVLAFYISNEHVLSLYSHPLVLWLICPLVLFWISRIWILARRGQLVDDPILFAITDPASWLVGIMAFAVILLAT